MTKFFATPVDPEGWTLEGILSEIQNEIVRRSQKIISDHRAETRAVLHNNIEILGLLTRCVHAAEDSTRILTTLGPAHGVDGQPRIGER